MDEHLTISTPEQVAFHYELAGIGSRFVASLLDHLIIGLVMFLIYCSAFALLPALSLSGLSDDDTTAAGLYVVLAVLVLIIFLVFWGYFALFETVWHGQTPGKRAGRLRVIRRDGQPIHAGESMVRNLVRIVDFMPGFYGIGLTTMFIDKDARRLGDMAAGTIVVREGENTRLRDVQVAASAPAVYAPPLPATYGVETQPQYGPYGTGTTPVTSPYSPSTVYAPQPPPVTRYDPLPGISIRDVTPDDYRLIRELLARVSRGELDRWRGEELAGRLAHGVATRMGQDFREWQSRGWDPLVFLQSVINAKEARE